MIQDPYQEQVSQYIDGELTDDATERLFVHLGTCPECRAFLQALLELRSKIHDEMLSEEWIGRVAGRSKTQSSTPLPRRILFPRKVASIIVVMLAVAIGFVVGRISNPGKVQVAGSQQTVYVAKLPVVEVRAY